MTQNLSTTMRSQEAADYLGVSIATLRRWSDKGAIRTYVTPGGHRRFYRVDLDKVLKGMRRK